MSTAGHPHTPHIFISHNSADNDLGYRLVRDLRAMYGEDAVWYDSRGGILPGDPWPERLQLELTARDTFLILLSPDSVRSPWVNDEINMAWQQHNGPLGKVIIPLLVRPCDIPPYLATIQYVSFLPDDPNHPYELALAELVNAIRLAKTRFRDIQRKPLIPAGPPHDTLPAPEHFVGRVADLAWVIDRMRHGGATAITALNGLGGIGKTALASEAARRLRDDEHRFRHGIIVVDCRETYDAAAILRTVLGRFPLDGSLDEADIPTLANLIRQHIRAKDILVLLDNIEPARIGWRVQDATRPLRDAGATLLLTSRQPLPGDAVPPNARYPLHLMQQDDALDLFAQSYGLPNATALSAENHAAVASIIATLERHTLAVKLAGAYARDLARPLATLAAELASDPLKVPDEDETPRAASLRRPLRLRHPRVWPPRRPRGSPVHRPSRCHPPTRRTPPAAIHHPNHRPHPRRYPRSPHTPRPPRRRPHRNAIASTATQCKCRDRPRAPASPRPRPPLRLLSPHSQYPPASQPHRRRLVCRLRKCDI